MVKRWMRDRWWNFEVRMPVPADWYQRQERVLEEYQRSPDKFGLPYDELFSKLILAEPGSSWKDFLAWLSELRGSWCFRGQRESAWSLRTSLDRAVRVSTTNGHHHLDRKGVESELLFRFQQQAHQFIHHAPPAEDKASWFALMQHHGVPTRFLDWTRSPYVALYFAVEDALQPSENQRLQQSDSHIEERQQEVRRRAVWAIDLHWLEAKERAHLGPAPNDAKARTTYLNGLFDQNEKPLIVGIDPPQANERMFAQQGFFLWKLFEETPFFDQILVSMMTDPILERPVIRKLEVDENLRIEFLEKLRDMNIHRASLFPGIDGFCQSLKLNLEIRVATRAAQVERALADAGEI